MARNAAGKFTNKTPDNVIIGNEVKPAVTDDDMVGMLLEKFRAMEERQSALERENADLAQELEDQQNRNAAAIAEAALRTMASVNDPLRPNALPPEADNSRLAGDRPGTLDEHLDALERLARENGTEFNRERTKRILLGQPVEDNNKFVYHGHAFDSERELEVYVAMAEREAKLTIGKYQG